MATVTCPLDASMAKKSDPADGKTEKDRSWPSGSDAVSGGPTSTPSSAFSPTDRLASATIGARLPSTTVRDTDTDADGPDAVDAVTDIGKTFTDIGKTVIDIGKVLSTDVQTNRQAILLRQGVKLCRQCCRI